VVRYDQLRRLIRLYTHRLRLLYDVQARRAPLVVANSVPKAGSHLLARCLDLMGLVNSRQHVHYLHSRSHMIKAFHRVRPGEFLTAHLPYDAFVARLVHDIQARMVVIIRDPRDVVVSHVHYVTYKDKNHRLRAYYRRLPNDHARLMTSIRGIPASPDAPYIYLPDIDQRFQGILRWREHGAYVVRFEDLIGPQGGGDAQRQRDEIQAIARHIGWPLTSEQVERIAQALFYQRSATFRKGIIGDWKRHFTDEHKRAFKEVAGDLLIRLGYEQDANW